MVTAQHRSGRIGKSYTLGGHEVPTGTGQLVLVLHVGPATKWTPSSSAVEAVPTGDNVIRPISHPFHQVRLPR